MFGCVQFLTKKKGLNYFKFGFNGSKTGNLQNQNSVLPLQIQKMLDLLILK